MRGSILEYVLNNFKNGPELAILALNKNIYAYEYISDELKQKEEIKKFEKEYSEAKNKNESKRSPRVIN